MTRDQVSLNIRRVPLPIVLVDAFTPIAGLGARTAVVLEADALDDAALCAAAAAAGVLETAFVVSPPDASIPKVRFFSALGEVALSAQALLATALRFAELGRISVPGQATFETRFGPVTVELERGSGNQTFVWIPIAPPVARPSPIAPEFVIELARGRAEMIDRRLPALAHGGLVFIGLTSRRELLALTPRFDALRDVGVAHGVRCLYLFARETSSSSALAHARSFTLQPSTTEEAVSGIAAGVLAALLASTGVPALPEAGGAVRAVVEQGDCLGRPGRVEVELIGRPGAVERVRIGGCGRSVIAGQLSA